MNVALTLGRDNAAMLVYDQPLGFTPAWVESAADGRGIRIIGESGQEFTAGLPDSKILEELSGLREIFLVRMENRQPVETFRASFIDQNYNGRQG